jgi:hypothetical protein
MKAPAPGVGGYWWPMRPAGMSTSTIAAASNDVTMPSTNVARQQAAAETAESSG